MKVVVSPEIMDKIRQLDKVSMLQVQNYLSELTTIRDTSELKIRHNDSRMESDIFMHRVSGECRVLYSKRPINGIETIIVLDVFKRK